jgi:hypothetical protein
VHFVSINPNTINGEDRVYFMQLTVRRSPLEAPLLDSRDAHTAELRDEGGRLLAVLLFPPGKQTFLFSHQQEPGFEAFAQGLGFQLQTQTHESSK